MPEVAEDIKTLGDKIVGLTLKQAVDLASYLKDTYQIEPAAVETHAIDQGLRLRQTKQPRLRIAGLRAGRGRADF